MSHPDTSERQSKKHMPRASHLVPTRYLQSCSGCWYASVKLAEKHVCSLWPSPSFSCTHNLLLLQGTNWRATQMLTCYLLREKSSRHWQPVEETLLNSGAAETGHTGLSHNNTAVCQFPSTTWVVPSTKQKKRIQRLLRGLNHQSPPGTCTTALYASQMKSSITFYPALVRFEEKT